jgi:mannose-1-phosphate guanylyltransferase/phosphomannomutase
MTATVRLLEYLAVRNMPLSKVVAELPPFNLVKESVECPWELKGTVMRVLISRTAGRQVEKIDGIKIRINDTEWVHISPNPDKPRFEIVAEAAHTERATELAADYRHLIHEIARGAPAPAANRRDE